MTLYVFSGSKENVRKRGGLEPEWNVFFLVTQLSGLKYFRDSKQVSRQID